MSRIVKLFWHILMAVAVIFFLMIVGFGILSVVQKHGGGFLGGLAGKIAHGARGDEVS